MSAAVVLAGDAAPRRVASVFEFWPGWLFYTPIVAYWIWLSVRLRGATLPTVCNPAIEAGGLCGESKSAILDQVGEAARAWVAPYVTVTAGSGAAAQAADAMARAGIGFPVVLKPDVGCHGSGVMLIADAAALAAGLARFEAGILLLVQEFVAWEGEAGAFYVRRPGEDAAITSLTIKRAPVLYGDGRSTLRELILADPRTGRISHLFLPRLADRLEEVVPSGAPFRLVFTGNHCRGSMFADGAAEITEVLTARIDAICRSLPDFHFGRVDLRYRDLASLKRGEAFRLIEINGAGSEATHVWDPDARLVASYRAQFFHYRAAFEIGAEMRRRGHRPMGMAALFRLWRRQTRLMAGHPEGD